MKKKVLTIAQLLKTADGLGWHTSPCNFANETGYELSKYSPAGQDFIVSIESTSDGTESPETLIKNLEEYINGYDPSAEALLWTGPDGHGHNGAPHELEDIISDMKACREMMRELLRAWKGEPAPQPFTIYRTIRIDGQFDTSKYDGVDEVVAAAVQKVIDDALAHIHTVEDGVEITDVTDCGDSV